MAAGSRPTLQGCQNHKKRWQQTCGGSTYRAFFSRYLCGHGQAMLDGAARKALFKEFSAEHRLKGEVGGLDEFVKRGRAGTVAHQQFGRAFQSRKNLRLEDVDQELAAMETDVGDRFNAGQIMTLPQTARRCLADAVVDVDRADAASSHEAAVEVHESSAKRLLASTDDVFKGISAGEGVRQVSQAPVELDLQIFHVTPPAKEICRRFMMKSQHGGSQQQQLDQQLLKACADRHALVRHDPFRTQKKRPPESKTKGSLNAISVCSRIGRCICNDPHKPYRAALTFAMRSFSRRTARVVGITNPIKLSSVCLCSRVRGVGTILNSGI